MRQRLVRIEALIERAESAQRGYLISGVELFLVERNKTIAKLEKSLISIWRLTAIDSQKLRLHTLQRLISTRQTTMLEEERKRRADAIPSIEINAGTVAGREARKQMLALTKAMTREEYSSLRAHRVAAKRRYSSEQDVLIAAALFGLIVLIPGYLGFVLQSRAREQTEHRLRLMADSLPGAMYQLRHQARGPSQMVFISAAVASVSKKTSPDWADLLEDIDERDRSAFAAELASCKQTLKPFRQSYRVLHSDGSTQGLHHEATLHKQSDGSILQNGYIFDVSEQRRLEEALVAAKKSADGANRAKSAFLATMSHEIRTPMNGALGMLELLSLTQLDTEQRTTLSIVRESSTSLLRLIDDILDFSMIEARKLQLRPEVVSIRDLIEGVRDIYSGVASSKGLPIWRSTDARISTAVNVDPMRLRQILNNLVSNALKFTTQGHVEIKAEWIARSEGEDKVRFLVRDTGIGVSPENQRTLFQAFSQGEGDASQHVGGTGLGLIISRRLAGLMGGSVEMVSELGVGTTMILTMSLPIADPLHLPSVSLVQAHERLSNMLRTRRPAPSVADALSAGSLILIVDDHPTNRMLLLRQVHTLGYAAESAENGVEALAIWQNKKFGLLITDCNMPEMDGYQLTENIRTIERSHNLKRLPIIACTANALGGQVEKCLSVGMDDCLVKPVNLTQLVRKLDQWLPLPNQVSSSESREIERPQTAANRALRKPLDHTVLAEISGGDAVVERSILSGFRAANDADAISLTLAVLNQDFGQITRTAHGMSGASKVIGALELAAICERIERAGKAADATAIAADMAALRSECLLLNTYFDSIQSVT